MTDSKLDASRRSVNSLARFQISAILPCLVALLVLGFLSGSAAGAEESFPEVDLVPQIGFGEDPVAFDISEDGVLAVITDRNSVRIWHRRVLRRIVRGHAFALGEAGEMIIASPRQGIFEFADLDRPDVLRFWPPGAEAPAWELAVDTAVHELYLLGSSAAADHDALQDSDPWLLVLGPRRMSLLARNRQELWSVEASSDAYFKGFLVGEQAGLVAAGHDENLELYSLLDGRRRLALPCALQHRMHSATGPVMSEDGRFVAAFCFRSLRIWSTGLQQGDGKSQPKATLLTDLDRGNPFALTHVAMDAGGRFAAIGGRAPIQIFDLERGTRSPLPSPSRMLSGLAFSSQGDRLLVSDWASGSNIWSLETRKKIQGVEAYRFMTSPRFDADDQLIHGILGSGVSTFGADSGKLVSFRESLPTGVTDLTFSPDGRFLTSVHRKQVRLWSFEDGSSTVFDGHKFAWTEDGSHLLIGPSEGRVQVLRLADQRIVGELREDRPILALAGGWADGFNRSVAGPSNSTRPAPKDLSMPWATLAATGSVDGTVSIWDVSIWDASIRDGSTARLLRRIDTGAQAIQSLLISASSGRLIVIPAGGYAQLYDLATGRKLAELNDGEKPGFGFFRLSPDGRRLAVGHRASPRAAIWRLAEGSLERRIQLPKFGVSGLLFLDSDRLLFGRSQDKPPLLVDLTRKKSTPVEIPELDRRQVLMAISSSEQGLFATGSDLGVVEIWRFGQGVKPSPSALPRPDTERVHHVEKITGLSWAPDGRYLASADQRGVIWLWDVEHGALGWLIAAGESTWGVVSLDGHWDGPPSHRQGIAAWLDGKAGPLRDVGFRRQPGLLATLIPTARRQEPKTEGDAVAVEHKATVATAEPIQATALLEAQAPEVPFLQVLDSALIGASRLPVVVPEPVAVQDPDRTLQVIVAQGLDIVIFEIAGDRKLRRLRTVANDKFFNAPRFLAAEGRRLHAGYEEKVYTLDLDEPGGRFQPSLTLRDQISNAFWWRDHLLLSTDRQLRRFRPLEEGGTATPHWGSPEKSWLDHRGFSAYFFAADEDLLVFSSSSDPTELTVVDATRAAAPQEVGRIVGRINVPGAARSLALDGTTAALAMRRGALILDLSDPTKPRQIGHAPTPNPAALAWRGGRLYVADDHLGLRVFSVENPASPELLAELEATSTRPYGHGTGLVWTEAGWILTTGWGVFLVADPFEESAHRSAEP